MNHQRVLLTAALTAAAYLCVNAQPVALVEAGAARLPILSTATNHPAAVELQRVIGKISGAMLPLSVATPGSVGIYVGTVTNFPWLNVAVSPGELGPEGCLVRTDGGSLLLLGGGEAGVSHAVVTFLHELGCRWFFPGEVWEVLPETPTIRGEWNMRQTPSFPIQRLLGYGFGAYPQTARDKREWDRHNRMGSSIPVSIGHASHGLTTNDFAANPDLFAMRNGKRVFGSKPCYSHPDYVKRSTARVLAAAVAREGMISMTPADGLGYCECPRCHEWARGGEVFWDKGSQFAKRPDGKLVCLTSESLFACINAAAKALRERHPGVLIGTYAYSAYSHPPSFAVEPNVFIQTTTAYRRTPMSLQEQLESFRQMGVQSGIRGYWSVYQWDWDGPVVTGELSLPRLINDIRFYATNNVRSLNTEMSANWGPRGLGYYLGARLLWNLDEDPAALIDEFYRLAFGPAAAAMERYYVRWLGEGVSRTASGKVAVVAAPEKSETPQDELGIVKTETTAFNRETLRAACIDLDEAARLVRDLPAYKARVDHLRLYAHYLVLRIRLDEAGKSGDREAIIKAVEAETVFGARLLKTNMIHVRPLIGKAFHRRFRAYEKHLKGLPEWPDDAVQGWNEGFRALRADTPDAAELETLWAADMAYLARE